MAEKEVKKVEEYGLYFGSTEKAATVIKTGTKEEIEKALNEALKAHKIAKTGGYFKMEKL